MDDFPPACTPAHFFTQVPLNLASPAPPGRGGRQGLWEDTAAGRASPGPRKSPDKHTF